MANTAKGTAVPKNQQAKETAASMAVVKNQAQKGKAISAKEKPFFKAEDRVKRLDELNNLAKRLNRAETRKERLSDFIEELKEENPKVLISFMVGHNTVFETSKAELAKVAADDVLKAVNSFIEEAQIEIEQFEI